MKIKLPAPQPRQPAPEGQGPGTRPEAGRSAQAESGATALATGKLLKGLILTSTTDGQVEVSLGGRSYTASSLIPMEAGQEAWFEVVRGGDAPVLAQAGRKGAIQDLFRFLFSGNRPGIGSGGGEPAQPGSSAPSPPAQQAAQPPTSGAQPGASPPSPAPPPGSAIPPTAQPTGTAQTPANGLANPASSQPAQPTPAGQPGTQASLPHPTTSVPAGLEKTASAPPQQSIPQGSEPVQQKGTPLDPPGRHSPPTVVRPQAGFSSPSTHSSQPAVSTEGPPPATPGQMSSLGQQPPGPQAYGNQTLSLQSSALLQPGGQAAGQPQTAQSGASSQPAVQPGTLPPLPSTQQGGAQQPPIPPDPGAPQQTATPSQHRGAPQFTAQPQSTTAAQHGATSQPSAPSQAASTPQPGAMPQLATPPQSSETQSAAPLPPSPAPQAPPASQGAPPVLPRSEGDTVVPIRHPSPPAPSAGNSPPIDRPGPAQPGSSAPSAASPQEAGLNKSPLADTARSPAMPEAQTVQPRPLLPGQKSPPPYLSAETRVPAPQSGTSGTVLQTQSTASRPGGTGQSNTIPQPDPGHILSFISRASQDQELDPSRPMRLATVLRGLETGSTAKEAPSQLINDLQTVLAGKEHSAADAGPAKEAATLARFLEIHSQINSQPAPQARQDFLLFPCFFAGNAGWGEWMFSFTKEGETGQGSSDEESYSLAFYLEMSRLGDVHIRVQAGEDGLQGIFSLADDEARTFVASQLDTLRQNFEDMGYGPVNLSCQTSKTGSLQRLKEEMTEKCGRQSFTILDLTV